MSPVEADQNLMFATLALQLKLIDERAFLDACTHLAAGTDMPLADSLVKRGALTPDGRRRVEERLAWGPRHSAFETVVSPDTPRLTPEIAGLHLTEAAAEESYATLPPTSGGTRTAPTSTRTDGPRGRYAVTRLHARGGLGTVWLAHDNELNRDVALKEIRQEVADDPEMWRRFLQEAQVTGQLEHPNIVPVYELARRTGDGQPFYTMRFVRGRTFREAIAEDHRRRKEGDDDPLTRLKLLQAFVSICQAVCYAHSRGVIHRDLKPENVVLGGFGEVILLDWGLAKLIDRPDESKEAWPAVAVAEDVVSGATFGQIGTPAYMAPEQAEARHDLVDHRTDVYGLGSVLFEILTGRAPHTGHGMAEVLARIATGETPRTLAVDPSVPAALDAVCARAMARDQGERYQSASELAEDVQRWLADEPVTAWREPPLTRAARWLRRHRTSLMAIIALVVTATSLTITALGYSVYRKTLETSVLRGKQLESEEAIAREREYFNLYNRARADRGERTPGWTNSVARNLNQAAKEAARIVGAASNGRNKLSLSRKSLRDEVVAGLVTIDADAVAPFPVNMPLSGPSHNFAISPDSRRIAVFPKRPWRRASFSGALFELDGGKRLRSFAFKGTLSVIQSIRDQNLETVNDVEFSPDGRWLALGTSDGQVHLWDLYRDDGQPFTWLAHNGPVLGLVFSTDSKALFSSAKAPDNALRRWPIPPPDGFLPEQARSLSAADWISPPALSADGSTLLVSTEKGLHRLNPLDLNGPIQPGFSFKEFAVNPDGFTLAGHDSRILLYPLRGGMIRTMSEPFGLAHLTSFRYRFNHDGSLLVSSCEGERNTGRGRNIKVWDLATHRHVVTIPVTGRQEFDAEFTPDGRHIIFVANHEVHIRKVHGYDVVTVEAHLPSPLKAAAWSPDGRAIVALGGEPSGGPAGFFLEAVHWDLTDPSKRELRSIDLPGGPDDATDGCNLSCHPDGNLVALSSAGKLHLWDRSRSGADAWRVVDLPKGRAELAFSGDGRRLWGLLTATDVNDVVFNVTPDGGGYEAIHKDEAGLKVLLSGQSGLNCIAASAGKVLVGGANADYLFDDANPKRPPKVSLTERELTYSVAVSGDGNWMAVGSSTGQVRVKQAHEGRTLELDQPFVSRVGALALSRDGRFLASGADDNSIRIHINDGKSLRELLRQKHNSYGIGGLAFSPDGSKLLIRVEFEYAVHVLHFDRLKARLEVMGLGW